MHIPDRYIPIYANQRVKRKEQKHVLVCVVPSKPSNQLTDHLPETSIKLLINGSSKQDQQKGNWKHSQWKGKGDRKAYRGEQQSDLHQRRSKERDGLEQRLLPLPLLLLQLCNSSGFEIPEKNKTRKTPNLMSNVKGLWGYSEASLNACAGKKVRKFDKKTD